MGNKQLFCLILQKMSRRKFHSSPKRCNQETSSSHWRLPLKQELRVPIPEETNSASIYRIPRNMLLVEPKAYRPSYISIGPYHYGRQRLQSMEKLKMSFCHRLFDPKLVEESKLDNVMEALEKMEGAARSCYLEEIQLKSDEFLRMMLVDASFIIQILRDLSQNEFKSVPSLKRWMLPALRRELIMLENQLPFFVLNEMFKLMDTTCSTQQPQSNLQGLALKFFSPLLHIDSSTIPSELIEEGSTRALHFLDLVHSSILLKGQSHKFGSKTSRGVQIETMPSVTELKDAGVKIKACKNRQLLDIRFKKNPKTLGLFMRELTIPPLYISDHRATMFRNMLAFENCHKGCDPDLTTYLFFFDGLINSAEDVALLHYKQVFHHSLGSNKQAANLINNLCNEVARCKNDSYLHEVVEQANAYHGNLYARIRTSLVHYYLSSWIVGISSAGALLALYFAFIQTATGIASAYRVLEEKTFHPFVVDSFLIPFRNKPTSEAKETQS